MNLNAMSIADLQALQSALGLVQQACVILGKLPDCGEGDLVIQMRPGEPVSVVTSWVMPATGAIVRPEAVVIEDFVAPALTVPVAIQAKDALRRAAALRRSAVDLTARSDAALQRAVIATGPEVPKQSVDGGTPTGAAGGVSRKVSAARVKPGKTEVPPRVTGPLTDAERLTILARMDVDSPSSIALDLNRRVQEVSLFIHTRRKTAQTQMTKDPVAQDTVVLTGGPVADASAPDTGQAPAAAQDAEFCAATPSGPIRDDIEMVEAPRVVVEIVPPAPQPSPALAGVIDPRPSRQRAIGIHVDRLKRRQGFDAELDLEVVEALAGGAKLNAVATDFGLDTADVKARWQDMTAPLLNARGHLAVDDQTYLLIELRRKVQEARAQAA